MKITLCVAWLSIAALANGQTAGNVIVTNLEGALRMTLTPGGNFLVSQTSLESNSGRISRVTKSGVRVAVLEGLPSGREVQGGGSGPTGMAYRDTTLYVAIGGGESERQGPRPGTSVWNPEGISSPLFASVLSFRFGKSIDETQGPFRLTMEDQMRLAGGDDVIKEDPAGNRVTVSVVADFPDLTPDRNTIYRGSNPFALAVSDDGNTLYVADASQNTIIRVDLRTGRARRIINFPPSPNMTGIGPPVVDYVPTSVRIYRGRLLVSNLTGFPFIPGAGQVRSYDLNGGQGALEIAGLTSATDIAVRDVAGRASQWYVLEFSANQSAQPAPPGALVMYDSPSRQVIAPAIPAATSLVIDGNSAYVLNLLGQITEVPLGN